MPSINQLIKECLALIQQEDFGDIRGIQELLNCASVETGAAICYIDEKGKPVAGYNNTEQKFSKEKRLSPFENLGTLRIDHDIELGELEDDCVDFLICIMIPIIRNINTKKNTAVLNSIAIVKSSVGSLSYSELEAVINVFKELGKEEGVIVASKLAERANLSRSVIVNALRKLESAGLIESRSLGVKGTYIKVLNKFLLSELEKL